MVQFLLEVQNIEKFHSKYHLWEDEQKNYLLTDLIEIHFIEMPKFRRFGEKDLKGNSLHRWLKFFDKMLSEEELKELMEMDSAIKRAEKKLEILSSDDETIALYKAREDALHERANMISSAKLDGKMEKAIEVAKNLLALELDFAIISKATGLTTEQIDNIQKSLTH
jgi:predicted transposase/invertase (TIGR01784 family)